MKLLRIAFIMSLSVFALSCSTDDDSQIPEEIENFIPPETIQILNELGFNLRNGSDVPDITGTFISDPNILENSNISNDIFPIGHQFGNRQYTFSNIQSNGTFSVSVAQDNSNEEILNPTNTLLVGNGNEFTALFQIESRNGDDSVQILCAVSGIISEAGIQEGQILLFVLEQLSGEPGRNFISPSQGRVVMDGDNLMERL